MTAGGEFGNLLRRAVVPRMRVIPGLRTKVLDSETPALRRSALVHRSRLAGMLCPNPVLQDGRRLDAILGTGFALISMIPPDAAQRARLDDCGTAVHIAEAGSDLAEWLRHGHAKAAIVRPDRTVMRADRRVDKLCAAVPGFTPNRRAE
jgi:3-(3-hydroxy-phenyl)propionate hydroxylase